MRNIFKSVERPTFFISMSHFLLLFGYKLFSLYYPLFLASKGFSFASIGAMYLLIYLSMAIASPLMNFEARKHNVLTLLITSIAGYAVYSLGMIYANAFLEFALLQIFLGVSSALFYISAKTMIISSRPKSYDKSFAYFYSAPLYSELLAPLTGGVILIISGFSAVFASSILIYLIAILASSAKLKKYTPCTLKKFDFKKYANNYVKAANIFKRDKLSLSLLAVAMVALLSTGVSRAFFVLFLKYLGIRQDSIVGFMAVFSIMSIPLSWKFAKIIGKNTSSGNISTGTAISGAFTLLLAFVGSVYSAFAVSLGDFAGKLASESGKSGLFSRKLKKYKEEAATFDTILTSLGVALGAFLGGIVVEHFGFRALFGAIGAIALVSGILGWKMGDERFK